MVISPLVRAPDVSQVMLETCARDNLHDVFIPSRPLPSPFVYNRKRLAHAVQEFVCGRRASSKLSRVSNWHYRNCMIIK